MQHASLPFQHFDVLPSEKNFVLTTESIKYIGSKKEVIGKILKIISILEQEETIRTVLDGFSGSCRVSQALANNGYCVFSNDTSHYSQVLAKCYLLNKKEKSFYRKKLAMLNGLKGVSGWFSQCYGGDGSKKLSIGADGKKKMFQLHNTQKLDAIIDKIHQEKDDVVKSTLLTSLMLALDKVDSSLGHQVSYLKEWAARAYNTMRLEVPNYTFSSQPHKIYREDILRLIKKVQVDLAYFDPPYCSNNEKMPASRVRYNAYYHIWSSVCLNDKPAVFGACNRRQDTSDTEAVSDFEQFKKDGKTNEYVTTLKIKELIQNAQAKFVLFSYSNNGRSSKQDLIKVLTELELNFLFYEFNHKKNVMFELKSTDEYANRKDNKEYLILIDKRKGKTLSRIEQQLNAIF